MRLSVCSIHGCPEFAVERGRCDKHLVKGSGGSGWQGTRDRKAQRQFRRAVFERFDGRCAAVVNGRRCPRTDGLEAHHLRPGNDDPELGVLLCEEHHKALDPHRN